MPDLRAVGLIFVGSILAIAGASICHAAGLRIEITRGNGSNNRANTRGTAPAVRVTDSTGKPVAGALVIFTAPSEGASLDFGSGVTAQTSTDESGTATAPAPRPVGGNGPVAVDVLAEKDGASANAIVSEMNIGFAQAEIAGDMEIVAVPDANPPKGQTGKRILRVRVTDVAGKPVVGASLHARFYPEKNVVEELASQSRADGIADFSVEARKLKGVTQIPVTAIAQGVTATRMVPVAAVP